MLCCGLVRLLLVAMLATQHTDFESFTKSLQIKSSLSVNQQTTE